MDKHNFPPLDTSCKLELKIAHYLCAYIVSDPCSKMQTPINSSNKHIAISIMRLLLFN